MIELRNVSKIYQMGEKEFYALKDVTLTIEQGDFVAVRGASGSGKTTLLNIIGCLDSYTEGTYTLEGQDIGSLNDGKKAEIRNSKIGFVLQDFALINTESVYYNVALPLLFSKVPYGQIKNKVKAALEIVGLADQSDKLANQLSGGQRQRVAIARALVNDPGVILADEPTGQLDSRTGRQIMELLTELNRQGKTVIVVTHDAQVASYCTRQLWVRDGWVTEPEGGIPAAPEAPVDLPEEPEESEEQAKAREEAFNSFAMVQGMLRLRKRWTIITAVMLALTLLFGFMVFATTETWLTAEEAILYIEKTDDGGMRWAKSKAVYGSYSGHPGDEPGNHYLLYTAKHYRTWLESDYEENFGSFPASKVNGEIVKYAWEDNYWYLDPQNGTPDVLLWDGGAPKPDMEENMMAGPFFAVTFLGPCCIYSAVLAALLIVIGLLLRKYPFGRGLMHTGAFFASFAGAILLVTNGRFLMHGSMALGWILSILLMTPMFFSTYLCCVKLRRVRTMSVATPEKA